MYTLLFIAFRCVCCSITLWSLIFSIATKSTFQCVSTYATLPRLRCLRNFVTEFNKNNRKYKIDKATVSHYMNSAQVTRYFHGNMWFINYDELEKVILRHLKAVKKRKKRKYN